VWRKALSLRREWVSLPETQTAGQLVANQLMLAGDGRPLHTDLVCLLSAVAVAGFIGSRETGAPAPIERAPPEVPARVAFSGFDRMVFAGLYALAPNGLDALRIVKTATVIRWHRAGFRPYWRWKSRSRGGRPRIPAEIRQLIRDTGTANPLWGAPRIHGELLKLGIEVGQTTVASYMAKRRRPPSQGWKTFLHNHADGIASLDLFVAPTISFRLLYGLLILSTRAGSCLVGSHRPSDHRMGCAAIYRGIRLARRTALPSTMRSARADA
jgi:hypothetical protein